MVKTFAPYRTIFFQLFFDENESCAGRSKFKGMAFVSNDLYIWNGREYRVYLVARNRALMSRRNEYNVFVHFAHMCLLCRAGVLTGLYQFFSVSYNGRFSHFVPTDGLMHDWTRLGLELLCLNCHYGEHYLEKSWLKKVLLYIGHSARQAVQY